MGFPLLRQFVGLRGGRGELSYDGREEGGMGTPPSTQGHPLKAELPAKLTGKSSRGKSKSIQRASGEEPGLHSAFMTYFMGRQQAGRTVGPQGRRPLPH